VFAGAAALLFAASADAAVRIEFTGMNMVFNGSALHDAGSASGGLADVNDADPLVTVDCFVDNVPVGSLYSDIFLDFYIAGINPFPSAPNSVSVQSVTPQASYFDLLIGNPASQGLLVDIQSVTVTYADIAGIVQFTFAGAVGAVYAQDLPFGLQVADPVTISLSSQVTPGSLNIDGDYVYGFTAFGTGEYDAAAVPAPGSMALMGLGGLVAIRRRRAR